MRYRTRCQVIIHIQNGDVKARVVGQWMSSLQMLSSRDYRKKEALGNAGRVTPREGRLQCESGCPRLDSGLIAGKLAIYRDEKFGVSRNPATYHFPTSALPCSNSYNSSCCIALEDFSQYPRAHVPLLTKFLFSDLLP